MALLGVSEAARLIGRDRSQIYRALKNNHLSAQKDELGATVIDTSELFRVFPPAANKNTANTTTNDVANTSPHGANGREQAIIDGLEREIRLLRERITDKDGMIDDLRHQCGRLLGVVESTTEQIRLLTDQREKAQAVAVAAIPTRRDRPWWAWW